jgi:G2/mitotic-specific cyclin 1/2
LGEVTVQNNKPVGLAGKGKEKETFDGVVIKAKGVTSRAPLRTVAATRQTVSAAVKKASHKELTVEEESMVVQDENAMAVDPAAQVALPSITVRRSSLVKEAHGITARRSDVPNRTSRHGLMPKHLPDDDFEGDQPAHKKRRTSSVPPEEPLILEQARAQNGEEDTLARINAEMQAFAEMPEADPESSLWDDLDANDTDDPLMVNEYVQDIFQYLKHIEVRYMIHHK